MRAVTVHDLAPGNSESTIVITIEADEKTPLLGSSWGQKSAHSRSTRKYSSDNESAIVGCCDVRLLGIAVLLVGGFTIATYLLVIESRLPAVSFTLDLVNRDVWNQAFISLGKLLNDTKVLHILMVQTGGEICTELDTCMGILRNMQKLQGKANGEIPYNFLIGGDGQTYEVRGWNHESGFNLLPQQPSLVIGFIGNYTSVLPTDVQCTSALSVINECVRRKKLHSSYQVFGLRNLSISHYDGEALFSRISKWQRFDTLLHVLMRNVFYFLKKDCGFKDKMNNGKLCILI